MSFEKQICFIEKKYRELGKLAEMFERDEIVERCVCKRNIRRRNSLAASKSARKCIELSHKSRVYAVTSYRIKNFVEFVNNAVIAGRLNKIKDMKSLVSNIEHGLSVMSFDLLDLYLDSFENSFGIDKQAKKHGDSFFNADAIQEQDSRPGESDSKSSNVDAHQAVVDRKATSEKDGHKCKIDKKSGSFESSLKIYKLVPDVEVDRLVSQLAEEAKMEEISFMYQKTKR